MDLVEIKKDVRAQTAKKVMDAVKATGDPALLPAKAPAKKAAAKVVSGPGPAPVKRATRTRKPAAKAAAPPVKGRVLTGPSTSEKQAAYWASRNQADLKAREAGDALRAQARSARAGMTRNQAAADRKTEFTEGMTAAEARVRATRRKRLQNTTATVAGGTAAAGALAGGAVALRRARSLRHLPPPGLNPTQRAMIGVGTGTSAGMLLAQRRRES